MAKKLEPISSHPWLVRSIDLSTKAHKILFQKAYFDKLEAEYVAIEAQNRLSNVEGNIITEVVDRKFNEVWETLSHYNANKNPNIDDLEKGTFSVPENLTQSEILWLLSEPTESLLKHRIAKAKELKKLENLKRKNNQKAKTR